MNTETHPRCNFIEYRGAKPCTKEKDNCRRHMKHTCVCCGNRATRTCDVYSGTSYCGHFICNDCEHKPHHEVEPVHQAKPKKKVVIQVELEVTLDTYIIDHAEEIGVQVVTAAVADYYGGVKLISAKVNK